MPLGFEVLNGVEALQFGQCAIPRASPKNKEASGPVISGDNYKGTIAHSIILQLGAHDRGHLYKPLLEVRHARSPSRFDRTLVWRAAARDIYAAD
jgi:hypothetical protein